MFLFRLITVIVLLSVSAGTVSAQLFGDRDIGRNRDRGAKDVESAATVTGTERFVRGNRAADDFVGAAPAGAAGFVGSSQAPVGAATTDSVIGLAEEAVPQVNVPRQRRATGIYAERLSVGFEPRPGEGIQLPPALILSEQLRQILDKRQFEVDLSAADSTATLRGTVDSPKQRRIAELLVLFEPGIATVKNELRVEPKAAR